MDLDLGHGTVDLVILLLGASLLLHGLHTHMAHMAHMADSLMHVRVAHAYMLTVAS